uniref:Uncharacterized protein n=1 Tax=Magallana gigas TaxID=29159 RepID=K1PZC5_MAGGI
MGFGREDDNFCWVRSTNGTEICSKCFKGYIGNKCELTCPYPGYGESCQQNCNCEEQYCNHITGCQDGSPTFTPNSKSATEIDRSMLVVPGIIHCINNRDIRMFNEVEV